MFQDIAPGGSLRFPSENSQRTSTPQLRDELVAPISPSVSSISQGSSSNHVLVPMEVEEETITSDLQTTSESTATGDSTEREIAIPRRIRWVGMWLPLKPEDENSLFFTIASTPRNIKEFVAYLIQDYEGSEKKITMKILQFFIDIAGFQCIQLKDIYNYEEMDATAVIDALKTQAKENPNRIFAFCKLSMFCSILETVINRFIDELLKECDSNDILSQGDLMVHVCHLLKLMSRTEVPPVRITSVILALKFLSCYTRMYREVLENSNSSELDRRYLENVIDVFYRIVNKNCLAQNEEYTLMRTKCAANMANFIINVPDVFLIKWKCLQKLMRLITDQDACVRLAALRTIKQLVSLQSIRREMTESIESCLKLASDRFSDCKDPVQVAAVDVFRAAIKLYSAYITKEHKSNLVTMIYSNSLKPAKAAAAFSVSFIRTHSDSPEKVVIMVVELAFLKRKFVELLPFYMEALSGLVPEFYNWDLILTILLSDVVEYDLKEKLLQMMKDNVLFFLTGNLSYQRAEKKQVDTKSDSHILLTEHIIPQAGSLLQHFFDKKNSLRYVTDILALIEYKYCEALDIKPIYLKLVKILKKLYIVITDSLILINITSILSQLCIICETEELIIDLGKTYICTIEDNWQNIIERDSDDDSDDVLSDVVEASMKTAILFAKFDFSDYFNCKDLLQIWNNDHVEHFRYFVECCKWHLVWMLRRAVKEPSEVPALTFGTYCDIFNNNCMELFPMNIKSTVLLLIFENYCDLHIQIFTELKTIEKYSIYCRGISNTVCNFVVKYITTNEKISPEVRRSHFRNFIQVAFFSQQPLKFYCEILQFYHLTYDVLGDIMEDLLEQIAEQNALPLAIVRTLALVYEEKNLNSKVISDKSPETQELEELAKRFSKLSHMKTKAPKVLTYAVTWAVAAETRVTFLRFVQSFTSSLTTEEKTDIYQYMNKTLKGKLRYNDSVLMFAKTLKI